MKEKEIRKIIEEMQAIVKRDEDLEIREEIQPRESGSRKTVEQIAYDNFVSRVEQNCRHAKNFSGTRYDGGVGEDNMVFFPISGVREASHIRVKLNGNESSAHLSRFENGHWVNVAELTNGIIQNGTREPGAMLTLAFCMQNGLRELKMAGFEVVGIHDGKLCASHNSSAKRVTLGEDGLPDSEVPKTASVAPLAGGEKVPTVSWPMHPPEYHMNAQIEFGYGIIRNMERLKRTGSETKTPNEMPTLDKGSLPSKEGIISGLTVSHSTRPPEMS
jgi:hypothetical protein